MSEFECAEHSDEQPLQSDEIEQLKQGGEQAVAELFSKYRSRFERMVSFRLDRRLYGRIDAEDVLQESYLEISRRICDYLEKPYASFFVWARQITWQTLLMAHRKHLGVQKRDAGLEIGLHRRGAGQATSMSLAAHLVAHLTSPSQAVIREERYAQLRETLEQMDKIDREVLALRHFEHLGNNEVAEVLGIQPKAASNRYLRALKRLQEIVNSMPELLEGLR
jgi:RNA polymerase sigma-70 factor (ECF subfamily)